VQKTLSEVGAVPSPMTPVEFAEFISAERRKWQDVVQAAGVQVQ
jgi:tripartite-type tricarboxylate transporter receptor subunit TctC